jgi:hypothetical protein
MTHRRDARLRAGRERLVAVRVLLGVVLHRERRAAVAVTLAQHKSNEKSWIAAHDDVLTIRHTATDGTVTVLKEGLKVLPREVIDATFLWAIVSARNASSAFAERNVASMTSRGRTLRPSLSHDEGVRPDHLRSRRARVLRRRLRHLRRAADRGGTDTCRFVMPLSLLT